MPLIKCDERGDQPIAQLVAYQFFAVLFPLVFFWRVLWGGFLIWDDNLNLIENPSLWQPTGQALRWIFTNIESVQRYKPVNWLVWRVLGLSFGLNPVGFHAFNLGLHAINAAVLFRIVRRFIVTLVVPSARAGAETAAASAALTGTLWWALHPLRAEPIAWISGAGYPLATFFALLSIWNFQRQPLHGSNRCNWRAILFFGLSLFSYPAAAALPGLLFAWAWLASPVSVSASRKFKSLVYLVLPYCILGALVLGTTLVVRLTTAGELWNQPAPLKVMGFGSRFMQSFAVWGWYLEKTVVPLNLAPVYPDFWAFDPFSFRSIASFATIIAVSAGAWRFRRRYPEIPALWGAFLFLAIPVLGLTEQPFSPADRYTYVPDLALALLFSSLLYRGFSRVRRTVVIFAAAAMTVAASAFATISQLQVWRNPVAFFNCAIDSVGSRPEAANLHWRLGLHYLSARQPADAATEFEIVVRLDPLDADAAHFLRVVRQHLAASAGKSPPDILPAVSK